MSRATLLGGCLLGFTLMLMLRPAWSVKVSSKKPYKLAVDKFIRRRNLLSGGSSALTREAALQALQFGKQAAKAATSLRVSQEEANRIEADCGWSYECKIARYLQPQPEYNMPPNIPKASLTLINAGNDHEASRNSPCKAARALLKMMEDAEDTVKAAADAGYTLQVSSMADTVATGRVLGCYATLAPTLSISEVATKIVALGTWDGIAQQMSNIAQTGSCPTTPSMDSLSVALAEGGEEVRAFVGRMLQMLMTNDVVSGDDLASAAFKCSVSRQLLQKGNDEAVQGWLAAIVRGAGDGRTASQDVACPVFSYLRLLEGKGAVLPLLVQASMSQAKAACPAAAGSP